MQVQYGTVFAAAGVLWLCYYVGWCIYSLYFHPLAKYPGPKFAAISDIWASIAHSSKRALFSTAQSFRDIHTPRGSKTFVKSELMYSNSDPEVAMGYERDPARHAALRKRFSPSFSAAAIKAREPMFHRYIDMFIDQIVALSKDREKGVNISACVDWLTFDILGELAFGESFDATKDGKTHFWTSVVTESTFVSILVGVRKRVPWAVVLFPFFIPPSAIKMFKRHEALTKEKVRKCVAMSSTDQRADMFSVAIEDHLAGKISEEYLVSEAMIMIVAGAETISTTLAACLFFISRDRKLMRRLQEEVRSRFEQSDDIDGLGTSTLPLLNAVIEETMRIYQPSSLALARVSPGAVVDGHYIPAGVVVSTQPFVQSYYEFDDPDTFRIDRWLSPGNSGEDRPGYATAKIYPFGLGSRACIGQNMAWTEVRLALSKLLYALDWEIVEGPEDFVMASRHQLMWKKPELWIKFKRV